MYRPLEFYTHTHTLREEEDMDLRGNVEGIREELGERKGANDENVLYSCMKFS